MIDRDKAIQMAKEAEMPSYVWKDGETYFDGVEVEHIQALVNRVRNEALEEAAYTANRVMKGDGMVSDIWLHEIEDAIRALKQEQTK